MSKILFTDASHPLAGELVCLLKKAGHEVFCASRPLTSKEEVRALISGVGTPDVLIVSGYAGAKETLDGGNADKIAEAAMANILSAFQTCKHFGCLMAEKGQGRIIYLSSIFADRTCGGNPAYSISQGALQMMMRELALFFGNQGITVNMIKLAPSVKEDENFESDTVAGHYDIETKVPTHQRITAEDAFGAISYLISPAAKNVNGTSLTLDGGLLNYYLDRSYTPVKEADLL